MRRGKDDADTSTHGTAYHFPLSIINASRQRRDRMLTKLFRSRTGGDAGATTVPPGERVYAIGDIHGRLDLLDYLLAEVDADDAARPPAATTLVLLGDVIDRGPQSAEVVERLRQLSAERPGTRFLLGNHEEVFLAALDGSERALRGFCKIGGRETILSYGIDPRRYEQMSYEDVADALETVVPPEHRAFLQSFEDMVVIGDYAFVHAGVHPGKALDAQNIVDLRWIREPFLDHRKRLEKLIVHGHTITPEVEWREHRIGIDTGAYESGCLTALGLEGSDRWVLQT